ncbi:hypothetical protein RHI9324_05449 [Rhizobium sp. CECT 9324]|nr:hypothetical protein RHI9324_05449 [Rhizobium sp. CECT 9324]
MNLMGFISLPAPTRPVTIWEMLKVAEFTKPLSLRRSEFSS